MTKKQIQVDDLSSVQYFVNKDKRFKTVMLISDLCDYSNAYIVLKVAIIVKRNDDDKKGSTPDDNNILDAAVVVPLKYLSNVWRSLDLPLINFETELDLSWSKEYMISEISKIPAVPGNPDANPLVPDITATQTVSETFQISKAKRFVPVVTLSNF